MNESQRMQYLSALDVDCYMPRLVLANAPKAQLCSISIAAATGSANSPADLVQPSSAVVNAHTSKGAFKASDVLASLAVTSSSPKKSITQKTAVILAADDKPTETNIQFEPVQPFSLSLQRVGPLLLIDSCSGDAALPTDRLLHSIAFALGYEHSQIKAAEVFNWPVTAGVDSVQTIDSLRLDLQAFLDGKLLSNPIEQLFLLGENSSKYFIDKELLYTDFLYQKIDLPSCSTTAIIAPSLSQILADAVSKRNFWLAIRDSRKL